MPKGKFPNINNKFYGSTLVDIDISATGSLGFDEFNAVLNNVNEAVKSTTIMRADFDYQEDEPSNINELLSGSADKIEIPDSNYTTLSQILPRYLGSKTISANYNVYSPAGNTTSVDGTIFPSWSGDQVLEYFNGNSIGKVPAIDLYSTHMVLFDKINIDEGTNDIDIIHCLYLIDDQGNKTPLSYKNNNLNSIQKLFQPSSRAEVVFLGNNTQNVYDNYPIVRSGIKTDKIINILNDAWIYDSPNLEISTTGSLSWSRQTTPTWNIFTLYAVKNFSASLGLNNNINLRYSASLDFPGLWIDAGICQLNNYNNAFTDNFTNLVSSLGPWYTLLYNPETGGLFEGTELETTIDSFELYSSTTLPNGQLIVPSIPVQSSLISIQSKLQIGDVLSFEQYDNAVENIGSGITNFDIFPVEDYFTRSLITSYEINNIIFPGPLNTSIVLNPVNITTPGSGWLIKARNSPTPAPNPAVNQATIYGDGWTNTTTNDSGNGSNFNNYSIQINRILNSIDYTPLLTSLKVGDLIKCRNISDPYNTSKQFNLMVLNNNQTPIAVGVYRLFIQVMNGQSEPLSVNASNLTDYEIYNITKFDDPYLELKLKNNSLPFTNLNNNINNLSTISIYREISHEQYIESQFLSGSGVGIIIPEDYNPALRDILPDIIKKTQIDINSLIQ